MSKKTGIELITEERQEQIEKHGWTLEHDSEEHGEGELAIVAAHLAVGHTIAALDLSESVPIWGENIFDDIKDDKIHRLKVAGALIAAEIDRLKALNK